MLTWFRRAVFAERKETLRNLRREYSLTYPFVLKPNLGQRGDGFKLVSTQAEAERYLEEVSV